MGYNLAYNLVIFILIVLIVHRTLGMSALSSKSHVAIVGGGIHGASIAFHLSKQIDAPKVTIVERSAGSSASYKAGGFLAREWGSGPTVQLHQKSFDLHVDLAKELNEPKARNEEPRRDLDLLDPDPLPRGDLDLRL